MILSASIDRTARVWDASSGACLHILPFGINFSIVPSCRHRRCTSSSDVSQGSFNARRVSQSCSVLQTLNVVEVLRLTRTLFRSGHLDSVRALSISASGELLATASGITARAMASARRVEVGAPLAQSEVWSSVTGACERAISSHPGTIYALQLLGERFRDKSLS